VEAVEEVSEVAERVIDIYFLVTVLMMIKIEK
jgi:hypothetical protein